MQFSHPGLPLVQAHKKLGQKGREEIKILMSHLVYAMIPNNEESGKRLLAQLKMQHGNVT